MAGSTIRLAAGKAAVSGRTTAPTSSGILKAERARRARSHTSKFARTQWRGKSFVRRSLFIERMKHGIEPRLGSTCGDSPRLKPDIEKQNQGIRNCNGNQDHRDE